MDSCFFCLVPGKVLLYSCFVDVDGIGDWGFFHYSCIISVLGCSIVR